MAASHARTSSALSNHLRVDGISVSFADRRVLTDVSFVVAAGERVGLIGENGSGKSTLLKVAAGLMRPDAGTVRAVAPGGESPGIGLLHQEPPFGPMVTVGEAIESAVAGSRTAVAAVDRAARALADAPPEDATAADAYARALETAERIGAWDVDARIASMLAGLGLAEVPRDRPTGRLSGGQRERIRPGTRCGRQQLRTVRRRRLGEHRHRCSRLDPHARSLC
ncbi:ATP-binding cassette domain-containing protein [uncultured Aeromicrobium sp.]|uniref:ATP-binding cassette domain-containing protein n=1 Tax=uncultured Aeromicrobium sp. TaxID=337820 RepID=UPI0025DA66A3|nr:ATP-binding cassette domain-containing protein [uncultured Aeromicrobium sp.]